uniref:Ig-like domain-containing protein n=1 Tax=Stegastes partitus TaxID=144197 RepID=A0A3B4ZVP2_9TELE
MIVGARWAGLIISELTDYENSFLQTAIQKPETFFCFFCPLRAEPRQVWVKKLFDSEPHHFQWHVRECRLQSVSGLLHSLSFPGVHVVQVLSGCELDSETGEVHGYRRFGYDGEEFMSDTDNDPMSANLLTNICPQWLKDYLNYGRNFLERRDLPSVSLLQKTASSPVTCHATGFYPDRADLFWTKDGEELHEDVDKGEILPNHDGSFQMSVDLNISSIAPEDWKRYHCVFQLSGVKDDIKTKLDKAAIRTNRGFPAGAVIGVVVVLLLLALCITGLFIWRKRYKGTQQHKNSCPAFTFKADIYKNISSKL